MKIALSGCGGGGGGKNGGGGVWQLVGAVGFSAGLAEDIFLALNTDGVPYVVYTDSRNDGKVTPMRFNGANWETVGDAGFTSYAAVSPSLALDDSGTPYVAFRNNGYGMRANVMKFNGVSWEIWAATTSPPGKSIKWTIKRWAIKAGTL